MQELVSRLLAELGEDPLREGLRDTPKRVEKSLRFLTSGYKADIDEVINNALFSVDYSEMVIVKDIDFYSLCEHHLLPFFGKCHIAYIPQKKVIGLTCAWPCGASRSRTRWPSRARCSEHSATTRAPAASSSS
jgi:GTP cyclohydrolase I